MRDLPLAPGSLVAERLRIVRELGRGSMGILFEALDITLGRRVALKVADEPFVRDSRTRARLLREARAAAQLESAHAVRVLEVGELGDGAAYVVMELLEGETIEAYLEREGPLPVEKAIDWLLQVVDAVAEAHGRGLVHRDLKPGNLFLSRTRAGTSVKVLDFGLVRDVAAGSSLTNSGEVLGSPAYMAPEQVRSSASADTRSDVWSLGVTLYEMLTRRLPFEATSVAGVLTRVCTGTPVPVGTYRAGLPPSLEVLLATCLAQDAAARPADARALGAELRAVLARLRDVRARLRDVRATLAPATLPAPAPAPAPAPVDVPRPRPLGPVLVATLVALVLSTALVVHASSRRRASSPAARSAPVVVTPSRTPGLAHVVIVAEPGVARLGNRAQMR